MVRPQDSGDKYFRIGPHLKRALCDPKSAFWTSVANYDIVPLAFQSADGNYVACNHSFENMVGREAAFVTGRTPSDIFESTTGAMLERTWRSVAARRERGSCTFWQRFKHGAYLYVQCVTMPVLDENGLVGLISLFLDATRLFLAEESLKTSLSILRHDLSAPLAGMAMVLQEMPQLMSRAAIAHQVEQVLHQLGVALETIRAWARVPEWAERGCPFTPEWSSARHLAAAVARALHAEFGDDVSVVTEVRGKKDILWSQDFVVKLIMRLLSLHVEQTANGVRLHMPIVVQMEVDDVAVTFRLRVPKAALPHPILDSLLLSDEIVVESMSHGAEVRLSDGESTQEYEVVLPSLQWARNGEKSSHIQAKDVVRDYEGIGFLSPNSLYCALFDLLRQRMAVFTEDGVLQACSYWFAQSLNKMPEDLVGLSYRELLAPRIVRILDEDWRECDRQTGYVGTIGTHSLPLYVGGTLAFYEMFVSNAAEGGRVLVISSVRDRLRVRRLLQIVMERGVVHLAHLLDTISEGLQSLADELSGWADESKYDIELMGQEVQHMRGVLRHWQRLAEIERKEYHLQTHPVDLLKVIQLALFEQHVDPRVLHVERTPDMWADANPFLMQGDESLLYTLFQNLISNAKRAAQDEDIAVRVRRNCHNIVVTIRNPGETPQYLRSVFFEKFVKGPDSPGMGLGTYSAKLVTDLHHGRIELDASEAGFTTVRVELPIT